MSDYIKKLYKLAGIEDYSIKNLRGFIPNGYKCITDENNKVLDIVIDFTAEKQLELIKWLAVHFEECKLCYDKDYKWCCQTYANSSYCCEKSEDALADLILSLWEDLSEEQRKEIKLILEKAF